MSEPARIHKAIEDLFSRIKLQNPQNLNISDFSRNSLMKYADNQTYYSSVYSQLLFKALNKLNKPVAESTFIDYGGGCGILSCLAKETGFKTVVYNDIYDKAVNDAQIISGSLDLTIDYFICGDIEEFINKINLHSIKPDLICSFDVLEHIYDLEFWMKTVARINSGFSLLFMTGANPENPVIANRLKKLHIKSECRGYAKNIRLKDIYLNTSFLEQREIIIRDKFPDLNDNEINMLAKKCRGLRTDDIERTVKDYIKTGTICYEVNHPTNTCDPYTGSWTERLIDLRQLKTIAESNNLKADFTNSFYGYSANRMLNTLKFLLNQMIKLSGRRNLFLSPSYTLEIQKQQNYTDPQPDPEILRKASEKADEFLVKFDKQNKIMNQVSLFTGFVMAVECFSSGFIALEGEGAG